MRWFRNWNVVMLAVAFLAVFALAAQAEIPAWVQWLPANSPALSILYRAFPTPAGPTSVRLPPRVTAPPLVLLAARNPLDAELVAFSAQEFEAQLDFMQAEARWKLLEAVSADRAASRIALADYYHRRMQPQQELQALASADARLPAVEDQLQPDNQQRAWKLHERVQQLIQAETVPAAAAIQDYEAWIAKYPQAESLYRRYFDFVLAAGMPARASQILERHQRTFPNDRVFPVHARTALAEKRGFPGGAIAVYDAAFDPLWPQELLDGYFKLLTDSHKLYDFYQNARRRALAAPLEAAPVGRLFHYYKKQEDLSAARRELSEFRVRKEAARASWTAPELSTLAKLSESADDYEEVIRYSYALYSLPGADDASVERALVQIITTLLKAPDRPIRFGLGNLSFYRDIATIDSSPGFLNGILSLIFNSQDPDTQFKSQEAKSQAYFHRAKAAEIYALLSDRFPMSARRSELLSRLIESYALYGENEAIIRQGTIFINAFPDAAQRTKVALQIADAHARQKQVPEELAVYDRLLRELAAKAQQVPLGGGAPRSGDYALVLQRNISRLRQLNRIPDALALYRREIDRNPNDPGLYDSLADFLGANQRASEVEQVYRQAMQRFQDRSWWHKLARFYLRNRQAGQFQALSREVVDAFSGADVEKYIADVAADAALERRLQLEINLYAQTRFPHDLRFVHNLIPLYSGGPTADSAALVRLLGQHWYEDEMIRRMYFERLAAGGSLRQVVQDAVNLLPEDSRNRWPQAEAANPAVTRFIAEAEAWQSHFESAAPVMRAVAAAYPADSLFAGRAVDLLRSLAAYDPGNTAVAASIADNLSRSEPRNRERLTRIGEIYADREMMGPATAVWARHPLIEPGKPDGYLEAATLSWDYLRPSDAMNWLRQGRTRLKDSALWTYEMGAILEAQGRRSDAVAEYLKGALAGRSNSRARLLQLATRVDYKTLVDTQTKRRVETSPADAQVLQLRVSVLRQQKRSSELEPMLGAITDGTSSREILSYIREVADESGLGLIRERVLRREAVVESDPQEQLRLRLELVELLEARGDLDQARREMESIYQSNSLISGVIRATADYYWRHDKPRSIQVLRSAAERAHASLKKDYLTETVRKSIEAKLYPDAIQSAEALLRIDPIDGSFIATMGDALAASGRDAELRQLYVSKISEIQQSQISQSDKTDRIALMRRGLIPVFVRQGEFREALDQFIEIINRFPNDENVLAEAGRLAAQHGLQSRLVDYYAKTVAEAPRDPRWSIILARIHTQFENYPAAIEAYTKAMSARPERQDLAIARAELEERTFRFADAIATYNRVYELSHGKPVWLERIAVLQARLGQNQDAIATLQRAYIDNRPEASREYGRVARVLEERGMIAPAADFMQRQIARGTQSGWERDYARIMTRARRYDEAFQVSLDGFNTRRVMGEAVALYFTPAEKQTFVSFLTERRRNARPEQLRNFTDIANAAHLYDLEVAWRLEEFARLSQQRDSEQEYGSLQALQQRRMRFAEWATQLEDLASKVQPNERPGVLISAMRAYREIGDSASELRLITAHSELQVADRQRYYELLSAARPEELLDLASRTDSAGLLAVQVLIAAGDRTRALEAVRTQKREPVWNGAYTGLVGLYFGSNSPEIRAAFQSVLGSPVIQDRVGKPVDRANQLAGDIWFYYGQRYAEYLRDLGESQAAADYWLSQVEARPADPEAYVELGRYFRDIAEPERAVAEFRHALELDAKRADIHSSIALVLWDSGKRNDALAEWRNGLTKFEKAPNSPAGPRIIRDIRSRQQADALRMEIDSALRTAARTQPIWQLPPLLEAAFENSMDDSWLLDVVGSSQTPGPLLSSLADQAWLSERQQKLVLQAAVRALSSAPGRSRFEYQQMRQKYMRFLLDHQDAPAARQLLDSFSDAEKRSAELRQTEIRIAAIEGMLEMLLQHYKLAPSEAPPDWTLQEAAAALDRAGSVNESRQVLEFLYSRQIEGFATNPTAFLGLAEIRVKQGRVNEAVDLLKRLNLISPVPFENLMASARVLSSGGRGTEAADFLKLRLQAVPWDDEARLELARVQLALNQAQGVIESLQQVAASARAAYDVRAQAAREQARSGSPQAGSSGSREMDLLSGRIQLTPETADGPYFFLTRMVAAEQSADPNVRVRLLLGAVAERPEDSAVRRLLFRAAVDSKQYRLALAVFRRGNSADSEINTSMGEAYLQLGQPRDAARSFALAASQERNAARKQALSERQKQALAANERLLEDERRRPVIRAGVDQPNPVKRRLP